MLVQPLPAELQARHLPHVPLQGPQLLLGENPVPVGVQVQELPQGRPLLQAQVGIPATKKAYSLYNFVSSYVFCYNVGFGHAVCEAGL